MEYTRGVAAAVAILMMFSVTALSVEPAEARQCEPGTPDCEKKDRCFWTLTGASGVPVSPDPTARSASQIATLDCPNHMLSEWDWQYSVRSNGTAPLPTDGDPPMVEYLGENPTVDGRTQFHWYVMVPNLQVYQVSLQVWTWKDVDGDGVPDDWAHDPFQDGGDCTMERDGQTFTYEGAPGPDGVVNACDCQMYRITWGQWN